QMTPAELADMILHEALLHESPLAPSPFPHRWMIDWLRISGQFDTVIASALRRRTENACGSQPEIDSNDPEAVIEPLLDWYLERLTPEASESNTARLPLNYLRRDWERFVQALVKRHQGQGNVEGKGAAPHGPPIVPDA